ncbi:hypothetical protein D9M69_592220 [compost metagenome]
MLLGIAQGERLFDEVAALADIDELGACNAIRLAVLHMQHNEPLKWVNYGFLNRMAEAAVVGLAAMRAGAKPFDCRFEEAKKAGLNATARYVVTVEGGAQ